MNRTIKVTGFSLKPALRQKLQDLFSSVAQVQKVFLSPDRDWYFGNESLRIRPAVPPREIAPIRSQRQPHFCAPVLRQPTWNDDAQFSHSENSTSDYQEFRETQNKFWIDVPHERCCMVPPRKKKPKTRRLDTVGPASTREKLARKAKKKKKKKRAYLESAASLPFGSSQNAETFPSEEAACCRQIFIKSTSSVAVSLPLSSTADDVCRLVSKETKLPLEVIHVTVDGQTLSDEIVRNIVPGSTLRCSVKGLGGADSEKDKKPGQQEEVASSDATTDEAAAVAQPTSSARKWRQQKAAKPAVEAETSHPDNTCPEDRGPYRPKCPPDEIHKGLPSMSSSDSTEAGKETILQSLEDKHPVKDRPSHKVPAQGALLKDADESQVQEWLQTICHISPEHLKLFDCMDGEILHEYKDFESLLLDVEISYGKARTIIFRRDNPDEHSALLQWAIEDVKRFVHTKLKKPDLDLSTFNEKEVDGVVLLSFSDGGELKRDLGLNGIVARRILAERNKFIASEPSQAEKSLETDAKNQEGNKNDDESDQGEQSKKHNRYLDEKDSDGAHMLFLQNSFHLQSLHLPTDSHTKSLKQCSLNILRVKEQSPSLLDNSFVFFILNVPGFPKKALLMLWKIIKSCTHNLWMERLKQHTSDQSRLEVEGTRLLLDGRELLFSKTATPSLISLSNYEKDVGKRYDQYQTQVLLIDKQLLTTKKDAPSRSGYSCKLGGKKDSASYHFGFEKDRLYLFFDSEDFASTIEERQIPDLEIGVAERCHLHLQSTEVEEVAKEVEEITPVTATDNHDESSKSTETDASGEAHDIAKQDPPRVIPGTYMYVCPREFKRDPESGKIYEESKILDVLECAHGMVNRSVELKYYVLDEDPNREKFLLKSLKFVCGCLNSRKNGTIYFGVPEKSVRMKQFQYGEIVGVTLQKKEQEKYYESLRKYLGRCFSSSDNAVERCVYGPFFVRIKTMDGNSCSEKYVIELDVEPCSDICKDSYFDFDASKLGKHLAQDSGVYLRDTGVGDGTVQTRRLQAQDKDKFVSDDLLASTEQRQKEETRWAHQLKLRIKSEASKLAGFMEKCDDSVCPILIVSEPTAEVKISIPDSLKFVKFIHWVAVFDFDYNSAQDGLFHMYQDPPYLKEAKDFAVTEFVVRTAEKQKEKLQMSAQVLWFFANGSSMESTFEKLDKREWFRKYYPHVKDALTFLQNPCVISKQRHHVLILVSAEMEDDIVRTVDDVASFSNIGLDSVFLVFDHEHTRRVFVAKSSHSEDIMERSAILPWQDVQRIVNGLFDLEQNDKHKHVVTASGSVAQVPPYQWMTWTDLTVVSSNECEESNLTFQSSKASQEESLFYKGGQVSWFNFFFPEQVLERSIQKLIEEQIILLSQKAISNTDIPKVMIYHMPGTGGTTLAKHIVWKFKTRFKCAVIERLTRDTFRHVCEFWEAGEHMTLKEDWKPVLLVSDNNTSDSAEMAESELCDLLFRRQKSDRLSRPIAILIVCRRSFRHGSDGFSLKQKLSDHREKMWMERTYKRLEGKVSPAHVNTFLGFLSMRNEFDMKKLQSIIVPYFMLDEGLSENERDLIVYIALIMQYFPPSMGSPGIPVSSCDFLLNQKQKPWDKNVSDVANVILVREHNPVIKAKVVRIANKTIAEVILRTIQEMDELSLADVVISCLNSFLVADLDQCESYGSSLTIQILRRMLLERFTETGEKGTMSPLILHILGESGLSKAVDILELGHQQLGGEAFYQQMARLYTNKEEFEMAVISARKAVTLCRSDKAEFFHTLGFVYMKYFQHLIRLKKDTPPAVENYTEELTVAVDSFTSLSEAQCSDDAITKSYACCDKIKLINLLLQCIMEKILCPDDYNKLGRFLTEEEYEMIDFDVLPELKEIVKQSFETGIETLRYMYNFGFSYKNGMKDYARQQRSNFPVSLSYTKMECVRQFKILATTMKTTIQPSRTGKLTEKSLRIENHKLTGSFFESILYFVSSFNDVKSGRRQKRETHIAKLKQIKANLNSILEYRMTTEDMDNYITVCLAMALVNKEKSGSTFASQRSQMYKLCNNIISAKDDEVRTMRAHLYRVLICWPTWKEGKVFSVQQFLVSFYNKPTYLMCRDGPLLPLVHFLIAKQSAAFHLCHWTEIFESGNAMFKWKRGRRDADETETEEEEKITTAMREKLQPFRGFYKIKDGSSRYVVEFNIGDYSDKFEEHLTIRSLRGEKIYRDTEVLFYLGFSLQGPVAYLYSLHT